MATGVAAVALAALLLALPALINRFPLIFPDSGTYLSIAWDRAYAVDRSSGYGLFLKALMALGLGLDGALAVQLLLVAAIAWAAARTLVGPRSALALLAALALLTSWPWHAAQFMPDAFTFAVVLIAWMMIGTDRSPGWRNFGWMLAAAAVLLVHYTHFPLYVAALAGACGARLLLGKPIRHRLFHPLAALAIAALVQINMNGLVLGQTALTPPGPLFLFARLHEDGLVQPWLDRHCDRPDLARLCALRPSLPRDSQLLLWDDNSPVKAIIRARGPRNAERWQLIHQMDIANRGAIAMQPLAFAANAFRQGGEQFVTFGAIDDECPEHCRPDHLVGKALGQYDPADLPRFSRSMQATTGLPVGPVRLVTTPLAALALLALPLVLLMAWRRRDPLLTTLTATILAALLANALLAGAVSDVHARYQSRLVWLAAFALLAAAARHWQGRGRPELSETSPG